MSPLLEPFLARLRAAVEQRSLVKLTLSAPRAKDSTLRNAYARLVSLRDGLRLSLVFREATQDITKNYSPAEGIDQVARLLESSFRTAHLFATDFEATWESPTEGAQPRFRVRPRPSTGNPPTLAHDRARHHLVDPAAPWLQALGVSGPDGKVHPTRSAKFRQIHRFVEILSHCLPERSEAPVRLMDMGCGKGYLTFAAYEWLRQRGDHPQATGVETREDLVRLCNHLARQQGMEGLSFEQGVIAGVTPPPGVDVLVALHACDTATDDALAAAVKAGARLILVAPCCHKELRPQLRPPPALTGAFRHGVFRERQAEFVTDALRAGLLEWAGYATRVFEFIASEHTAKNLMIAATLRNGPHRTSQEAEPVRWLASSYGIERQRLAQALGFSLARGGEREGESGPAGEGCAGTP